MRYTNQYGKTYDLVFTKDEYVMGGFAITAFCEDGPYATVTKWLPAPTTNDRCAYLDTNNCQHLIDWLVDEGCVTLTGCCVASGFCTYPEGMFDETWLATL